ncbi:hypothetical protein [Falsiroseomonas sp. E2-1-a20]|uniref:hypothetical protein n=1 Tax=Falsiroseomonas sp. E2-1-a20 TaxID=3239300 RepID=UPI003F3E6DCE
MPAEPARLRAIDPSPAPQRRRDPFSPPAGVPQSRPIAKPEEGERRGEGLAAIGSFLVIIGAAALVAWLLCLAFG